MAENITFQTFNLKIISTPGGNNRKRYLADNLPPNWPLHSNETPSVPTCAQKRAHIGNSVEKSFKISKFKANQAHHNICSGIKLKLRANPKDWDILRNSAMKTEWETLFQSLTSWSNSWAFCRLFNWSHPRRLGCYRSPFLNFIATRSLRPNWPMLGQCRSGKNAFTKQNQSQPNH